MKRRDSVITRARWIFYMRMEISVQFSRNWVGLRHLKSAPFAYVTISQSSRLRISKRLIEVRMWIELIYFAILQGSSRDVITVISALALAVGNCIGLWIGLYSPLDYLFQYNIIQLHWSYYKNLKNPLITWWQSLLS